MSKAINITQEMIEETLNEFREMLAKGRIQNGTISFSKSIGKNDKKTTLYFTEMAYLKMMMLVWTSDKEVGWHGLAYKKNGEYIITDILVYPQKVTGATVESDDDRYPEWLVKLDDDTFKALNMQGHSHVNMGVTPSQTDENDQKMILTQKLKDDSFYIFMIINKKGEKTIRIYDLEDNALYETADVSVKLIKDGTGIMDFLDEAEDLVQEKKYTPVKVTNPPAETQKKYTYGNKNGSSSWGYDDDDDYSAYYWRNYYGKGSGYYD